MSKLVIGSGALGQLGESMREIGLRGRAFLISNERIYPLYGAAAEASLRAAAYDVATYQLPDGESTKSLAHAARVYDWLADQRAERIDAIVALGGGVVGDVSGFTAATFLRGMPLVQVPTTLLAQIDSSIGGKVGVNHSKGKNLIGAFHPARLIVADVDTLRSLSRRELAAGWAEAVKCGLILDAELLGLLAENAAGLIDHESSIFRSPLLSTLVRRCAEHKVRIVEQDEREANLRMILNYGHTIGHGLEAALNYGCLLHGEAVSIGMAGAARLAVNRGLLSEEAERAQNAVLARFGLPTRLPADAPCPSVEAILDRMAQDKKSVGTHLQWILLDRIGHARIESGIPLDLVRATVADLLGRSSGAPA